MRWVFVVFLAVTGDLATHFEGGSGRLIDYLRAAAPAADPGTHQGGGVLQLALAKKLWFR